MKKVDVKGYEGFYQVTDLGMVYSVPRVDVQGKIVGGNYLKLSNNGKGYFKVLLSKNGVHKRVYIHRLVAEHFLENKENKPCVNHKNGDTSNNSTDNLEWCTYKENAKHSFDVLGRQGVMTGRFGKNHNRSKTYLQFDMQGNFIKEWYSSYEIQRELGILQQNISKVCKKKRNSAGGFKWAYK